jgi:hypothetical protein
VIQLLGSRNSSRVLAPPMRLLKSRVDVGVRGYASIAVRVALTVQYSS